MNKPFAHSLFRYQSGGTIKLDSFSFNWISLPYFINAAVNEDSMLVCLHIRGQGQCQILDNY